MTGVEFPTSDPETDNGTARPEQVAGVRARNRRMLWMKLRDGAGLAEHGAGFEKVDCCTHQGDGSDADAHPVVHPCVPLRLSICRHGCAKRRSESQQQPTTGHDGGSGSIRAGCPRSLPATRQASLDHTVFFYSDSFTTAEWLLHVVDSPRTGGGRGVVTGRFYTQSGELIAVCVQEGVVRAAPRKEDGPGAKGKDAAKL